jgi:DNA-binding transcriptional regulator GbsR (MarR family)
MNVNSQETDQISPAVEAIVGKARDRVIEAIAQNMDLYGMTLSVGHLYGTLFFKDKPMSLDEMVEALGMSKTSMSTGVRSLMDLNMVNKVWMKGTRKDHYEVELDWYQNFIDYFSLRWRKAIDENTLAFRKSKQDLLRVLQHEGLSENTKTTIQKDIEKIDNALDYYDWLLRLIDMMESHEIFKFVPKSQREEAD